jgi:TonB family protein
LKYIIALILSITIHIALYYVLIIENKTSTNTIEEAKAENSRIRFVSIKKEKKIVPKNLTQEFKKVPRKVIKKVVKKPEKKIIPKKIIPKKKIVPKKQTKPKAKIIKKPVVKSLPKTQEQKEIQEVSQLEKQIDENTQSYIDLYGKEFDDLHPRTKIFLLKNIKSIAYVTQRYLEYPIMSAQIGQEGVNVVEFILFPQGHITNLKITKSSSFFILDDNTIETIQEAFMEYPKPAQPTIIKIYVKYQLIRN